ncbi:MAG TPA: FxsA family protein [Aurantimonas sp.]|uniref:Membrane protein FxsA n=1 Tax=Aurantimonas marianensis TaxID=2920428 RepID=A0A9X2HE20_9HYPH|nr:FxsA family protein [Aurantimonas marianensis]MCP3056792.1 membrane protein FxsA [Aurantimonas marianensis]
MPFALIPFLLLVIPILEIAVFILVGNMIGLWPTLGLVLLTAIVGTLLLKQQGLSTLARIQADIRAKRMPGRDLVHGVMIAIAGVLLLTPGLVTDALGFLLFVPKIRDGIWNFMKSRVIVVAHGAAGTGAFAPGGQGPRPRGPGGAPDVVDLSGEEFERRPDPSSPWNDKRDGHDTPQGRILH